MESSYSKIENGQFILLTENTLYPDNVDVSKIPKVPDPRLETGLPLPKELRAKFPRRLIGIPIQEIDPYYYNRETFVVVTANWTIDRLSSSKAFWYLSPFSKPRAASIRIVSHSLFRLIMHLVIISFTFIEVLPISFMDYSWIIFCFIFAAEVVLKIVAYGFLLSPFSYLRNPWNWLDFTLTNTGWFIGLTVDRNHIVHPLRSLRLLQLGTVSRLSFNWVFRSVRLLKDLLIFVAFMFVIFTLVALHTYHGIMQNKCVKDDKNSWTFNLTYLHYARKHGVRHIDLSWYLLEGETYIICGNNSGSNQCPEGYTCHADTEINSNYGYTNFDNFGWASMQVARLMTVDLWDSLFQQVRSTLGPWNIIYFLVVVIFGGHLVTNLLASHIAVGYGQLLNIIDGSKLEDPDNDKETTEDQKSVEVRDTNEAGPSHAAEASPILVDTGIENVDVDAAETIEEYDDDDCESETANEVYSVGCDGDVAQRLCLVILDLFCAWKCCDCCDTMRRYLQAAVNHWSFKAIVSACILLNAIQCLTLNDINAKYNDIIHTIIRINIYVAFIEAVLKNLAYTPKQYFKNPWNIMDFIIILIGILNEIAFVVLHSADNVGFILVFRVFHLVKWWPNLRALINMAGTNTTMLILTVVIFANMGCRMFFMKYRAFLREHPLEKLPLWNFHNNANSFVTVIRVLCGEWTEPFWHCHRINGWTCAPYFMALFVVGNLVIINVFVAMLLGSIRSHNLCDTDYEADEVTFYTKHKMAALRGWTWIVSLVFRKESSTSGGGELTSAEVRTATTEAQFTISLEAEDESDRGPPTNSFRSWYNRVKLELKPRESRPTRRLSSLQDRLVTVMENSYCSIAYIIFIVAASIPWAFDDINLRTSDSIAHTMNMVSLLVGLAVATIFLVEVILKWFCYGCPKEWLNDNWNLFDLTITLLQLVTLWAFNGTMFVYLLPLKLIPRVENLRVVAKTLMYGCGDLLDTVLACGFTWLVMSAVCLYYYSELQWICLEEYGDGSRENMTFSEDCLFYENTWMNSLVNFNNLGSSLLALLQVALSKGWMVSSEKNPTEFIRPDLIHLVEGILFGLFLVFGILSALALIIRTFVKKTNKQKKEITKESSYITLLMTKGQRKSYNANSDLFFVKPIKALPRPDERLCCSSIYEFVSTGKFDVVVTLVLLFNTVTLTLLVHNHKTNLKMALQYVDRVFVSFFVFETTLKLLTLRKLFFQCHWNIYDLIVHFLSLLNIILNVTLAKYVTSQFVFATYFFAILRVIRLARFIKSVRYVASSLWRLWPAFLNVTLFVSICVYVTSLVGMGAFKFAALRGSIDDYHNFQTFASSLLVVSKLTLTADWMGILVGLLEQGYLFSFIFVTVYILWSLFIAIQFGTIILLEFYSSLRRKLSLGITDDILNEFSHTWKILDRDGTGYIPLDTLPDLIHSLPSPLQMERPSALQVALLDLPIYAQDRIAHDDLLRCLLRGLDPESRVNVVEGVDQSADDDSRGENVGNYDVSDAAVSTTLQRHRQINAAKIQQWWRSKRNQREEF